MSVLVGTEDGVFAVEDGAEPRVELAGAITALATADTGECCAVADGRSLARRGTDGRWTVRDVDVGEPIRALLPTADGVLVGTTEARVALVDDGRAVVLDGFGRVAGRDTWHAVGSRTPYVRSLTAVGGTWFASVHVGGIPRSVDQGRSWEPTVDVEHDVHEVRADPGGGGVVMAAAAVGLLESRDTGATWSPPASSGLHATYLRAVAFTDDAVVVSASDGPFGRRPALYRRDLAGGSFERCTAGIPEWLPAIVDTGALAAHGRHLVAGTDDTVYGSDDGARTWRLLASGLPGVRAVALVPGSVAGRG